MRCTACRKEDAHLTLWERTRNKFFQLFHQDVIDLSQEKYTMGFGEGYQNAYKRLNGDGRIDITLERIEDKVDRALKPLMPMGKFEAVATESVVETIISAGRPVLILDGKQLSPQEREQLVAEADYFTRSNLWRIMQETVKQKAIEKTVIQSKSWEEVLSGKMMLHNLGIQKSILDLIIKK